MTIADCIRDCHETAKSKGWWEEPVRTFGDQIALMHSELSETLEEFRNNGVVPDLFLYTGFKRDDETNSQWPVLEKGKKPEGIAAEFADVLIRIFDTCGHSGIPLEEALKLKMEYNKTRPHRHGGKKL